MAESPRLHPHELARLRRRLESLPGADCFAAPVTVREALGLVAEIEYLEAAVDEQQGRVATYRGQLGVLRRAMPFAVAPERG